MNTDFLISLLIVTIVVGAIVYLVRFLPIDETFKAVVKVVAIVGWVIWLLLQLRALL